MSLSGAVKSSFAGEQRREPNGEVEQRLVASGPADEGEPHGAAGRHARRNGDLRQAGVARQTGAAEGMRPELDGRSAVR